MKTLISAALFMALLLSAVPNLSNAQALTQAVSFNLAPLTESFSAPLSEEKSGEKASTSAISEKALKDFGRTFKNVHNQTWYKVPSGGYIANFLSEGIDYRIGYNQRGNWRYNLLTYTEDHLPFEIRDLVKSQYYDYNIFVCFEYQCLEGKAYIIKMEDATSYKTVTVFDGEIVSVEDLIKSK